MRALVLRDWCCRRASRFRTSSGPNGIAAWNRGDASANCDCFSTIADVFVWDRVGGLAGFFGVIVDEGLQDRAVGDFAGKVCALIESFLERGVVTDFPAILEVLNEAD